ncbi:MAG: DUF4390 domain-containing protein [Thiobacillaceae bacterium]|jgi:hypothetical protein|nr:DUF4390 domain-containing protein [Thiobacillaceae bacterium]
MPAWSRRDFLRAAVACAVALGLPRTAGAEGIQLLAVEIEQRGEIWQLSGGFRIHLSRTLEDALRRGVQLTFVQEFEATRPRSYWFAEDIAELSRVIRVSYNALLRQYYVTVGGVSATHTSLDDALDFAGDFSDWAVLHQSQVRRRHSYDLAVRMYLDTSQLPKPLQVNAVASQRWQLDSGWREWTFQP